MSWRGEKIGGMSSEEMNEFLAGPWLARVACLKPDGWPYVVPVWYHWGCVSGWWGGSGRSGPSIWPSTLGRH